MPRAQIKGRLDRGMSIERAVLKSNLKQGEQFTHLGRTQNLRQWASEFNINEATLRERVTKLGWPLERALTETVHVEKRNKSLDKG